ncbi:MAG TPA: helix-hairpin-helix domain-containing protein, partial [Candidatus Saccharimonadales bacterium]
SAHKLVSAIQDKKNPDLNRFIYGLGIRHIGVQTAIDLANNFISLEALSEAKVSELSEVEGIGSIVAESVVEWFSEPVNQKLLTKFKKLAVRPKAAHVTNGPLSGQHFVVTGSLNSMSREEAADKIRSLGGNFQASVGKDTDILVVGNNVGENKLTRARKLNIKQIKEQDFLNLVK